MCSNRGARRDGGEEGMREAWWSAVAALRGEARDGRAKWGDIFVRDEDGREYTGLLDL